jgi:hypothetical protein
VTPRTMSRAGGHGAVAPSGPEKDGVLSCGKEQIRAHLSASGPADAKRTRHGRKPDAQRTGGNPAEPDAVRRLSLDFPPVAGHLGYAAIVDGDGLRVV